MPLARSRASTGAPPAGSVWPPAEEIASTRIRAAIATVGAIRNESVFTGDIFASSRPSGRATRCRPPVRAGHPGEQGRGGSLTGLLSDILLRHHREER